MGPQYISYGMLAIACLIVTNTLTSKTTWRHLHCYRADLGVRYMAQLNFDAIAKSIGVARKKHHIILEAWPTALKLKPTQIGAQEESKPLLASSYTGLERNVEWKMVG
jgi:hypothetical protein